MSNTNTEKLKVKQLSKYGVQLESGEYLNWSKNFNESLKGLVVPGKEFEFVLWSSEGGKRYINDVKDVVSAKVLQKDGKNEVKQAIKPEVDKPVTTPAPNGMMSKEEWQAKDTRISRQGAIQAAVQATGGDFDEAEKLANLMLGFVNKKGE